MLRRCHLLLLLPAPFLHGVELGQSRDSLVAELGAPTSSATVSGVEILSYPQYTIHFTDGRITRIQRWANSRRNPGLAHQAPGGIKLRMPRDQVIQRLGQPPRITSNGALEQLFYPDQTITLRNGLVSGITPGTRRASAPAPTPAKPPPAAGPKSVHTETFSATAPAAPQPPEPGAVTMTPLSRLPSEEMTPPPAVALGPAQKSATPGAPPPEAAKKSPPSPTTRKASNTAVAVRPDRSRASAPAAAAPPVATVAPRPAVVRSAPRWLDQAEDFFHRLRDPVEREKLLNEEPPPGFLAAWIGGMLLAVALVGLRLLRRQSHVERRFQANREQHRRREPPRIGS